VKGSLCVNIRIMKFLSLSRAQKVHFHSAPCYRLRKIRFNTRCYVYRNLSYPPPSQQPLPPRDYQKKPFHMRPPPVSLQEHRGVSHGPRPVQRRPLPVQIKNRTLSCPQANHHKKIEVTFLHRRAPEPLSHSLPLVSPVKQSPSNLTDCPSFLNYEGITCLPLTQARELARPR